MKNRDWGVNKYVFTLSIQYHCSQYKKCYKIICTSTYVQWTRSLFYACTCQRIQGFDLFSHHIMSKAQLYRKPKQFLNDQIFSNTWYKRQQSTVYFKQINRLIRIVTWLNAPKHDVINRSRDNNYYHCMNYSD